jgi:hypothetical protein
VFSDSGVGIGAFGTVGSTFNSFVLQPGIYQVHLSIDAVMRPAAIQGDLVAGNGGARMLLNNSPGAAHQSEWFAPVIVVPNGLQPGIQLPANMGGDRLFAVASANTTLSFHNDLSGGLGSSGSNTLTIGSADCILIITQLQ